MTVVDREILRYPQYMFGGCYIVSIFLNKLLPEIKLDQITSLNLLL